MKMARWTAAEQRDQARGDPSGSGVRRMKVVLIGDSSVGKSALVYRFINNTLLADPKATVGISFFKQTLMDPLMNQQYPLQIWDTAGQEKFQSVTTHHYRAADGALLVFDIANERSFQNLDKWLAELRENTDPSVVVALVGTKADLSAQRAVSTERAQGYARGNGLLYVETSAYWNKYEGAEKDLAVGVEQIFLRLVRGIIQTQKELGRNPARLDMSGYPEAINLEEEGRRRDSECAC
ncbi:YPT31 [Symbiodinium sp. CCMP2592]|nr:YPT31 [Symbiodinium sp. CCMP2592]